MTRRVAVALRTARVVADSPAAVLVAWWDAVRGWSRRNVAREVWP